MKGIRGIPRVRIIAVGAVAIVLSLAGLALSLPWIGPTAAQPPLDPYAVVAVTHLATDGGQNNIPVEPNTGAHWVVTGTWYNPLVYPALHTETGSLDVDWNGSSWVVSNAVATNNILGYDSSCVVGACGSPTLDHGYAFKLMASVHDPDNRNRGLVSVKFEASPDDGAELVGSPCGYGSSVSPVYPYVFVATDTGPFDAAPLSCSFSGPSLTLPYEP